jgi:hypothetical protein
MTSPKSIIQSLKRDSFNEANSLAIPIENSTNKVIGKLVPVGNWILSDEEKIEKISAWRQNAMRMFLTQFQSTYERTLNYLKHISIGQEGRIFFLVYDENDRFVGHIGIAGIENDKGELDNLMRGEIGGDPRLIYFAEVSLLNWCFKKLALQLSDVGVFSYNWLVISLHEEVGYIKTEKIFLRRHEKDSVIFHDPVDSKDSNVKYSYTKMLLQKESFYLKANWLMS